jgi:amicyanin
MKKGVVIGIVVIAILLIGAVIYFYFMNPPISDEEIQNLSEQNIILIDGFKYTPQEFNISVGETVTWINKDSIKHTVTSDEGGELNSTFLGNEESYSHTFNEAGEYSYYCIPHPFMTGKINVI